MLPPTTFIPGCLDPIAQNYDSLATVHAWGPNEGDSQCEYLIGCMNPLALNYDSLATQDDYELCIFPPCNGFDTSSVTQSCNGNQVELSFHVANNTMVYFVTLTQYITVMT